jgi:hypothetical protein
VKMLDYLNAAIFMVGLLLVAVALIRACQP